MLIVTTVFLLIFVVALLLGPETKGKILVSDHRAEARAAGRGRGPGLI
jgi:hypothetical protein